MQKFISWSIIAMERRNAQPPSVVDYNYWGKIVIKKEKVSRAFLTFFFVFFVVVMATTIVLWEGDISREFRNTKNWGLGEDILIYEINKALKRFQFPE